VRKPMSPQPIISSRGLRNRLAKVRELFIDIC
jgi:hypothetical protein